MVFALVSCDPPKSPKKPCAAGEPKGEARYTLAKNADNTTYTLTIAECVKTIAEGEFSSLGSVSVGIREKGVATRLKLDAKPEEAVTAIVLPSTLQTIGDYAFYNHTKVTGTFTIPKQVQSIGKNSFQKLGALSSALNITFAESSQLTVIKEEAFKLARISVLKLPQSLETIEDGAFLNLTGVSAANTFTIPANVKKIGGLGFANARQTIKGTLTIESRHLIRTPKDINQDLTGNLGQSLFVMAHIIPAGNFTTIKLLKNVYDSYTTADLDAIFGTGATYQKLDGTAHAAKTS